MAELITSLMFGWNKQNNNSRGAIAVVSSLDLAKATFFKTIITIMIKIKQGDRYGLLTIKSEAPRYNHKRIMYPRRLMNVTCDCRPNREIVVRLDHLRQGATKSCGCLKSNTKTKAI